MSTAVLTTIVRILVGVIITAFFFYLRQASSKDDSQDKEISSMKTALNNRPTRDEVHEIIKGSHVMADRLTDSHREHCEFKFIRLEESIKRLEKAMDRLRERSQ